MNNWTSQPMGQHGIAMPSFDNYDDSATLSFENHFDDSYDEKSWSDPYDMTLGEFYGRLQDGQYDSSDAEFAFIPALLGALPKIIQGVSKVIPRVVQGVSSAVGSFSRPQQAPNPAPYPNFGAAPLSVAPQPPTGMALPRPKPRPRHFFPKPMHTPPPPIPAPQVSPAPGVNNSTLATLLALLSDPGLQSAIQTASGSASIPIGGNSNLPVSSVMDIIGQLAGAVTGNEVPPAQEAYPDFLFDSYGNALVNLDSAEDIGNLLLDRIQST